MVRGDDMETTLIPSLKFHEIKDLFTSSYIIPEEFKGIVKKAINQYSQPNKKSDSIEMFNLNEVYESHKDFVRELMYKNFVYSNTYKEQLNKLFSNMKLNPSEINLFLYGSRLDAKELNTRPLSKLAFDVINEN